MNGPRDRIATHLRRILVAAGMALPQVGHADTSTPNGGKGKQPTKPPPQTPGKKPGKGETTHRYEVVDMLPPPFIEPREEKGALDLRTYPPGASVLIDGNDPGIKTPLTDHKLSAGIHAVTVKMGSTVQNFTVEIRANKTHVEIRDLRPSPSPEPKK
jgi:hypothetical protein